MRKYIYAGIFFISFSMLMLEATLTRLFSAVLWYHFAFLIISLALLGIGISSICIYAFPKKFLKESLQKQLTLFSIFFSISIFIMLLVLLNAGREVNISWSHLILVLGITTLPFFFGGICISLALFHLARQISKLYFYDLIGGSLACILAMPFLNLLGAVTAILAMSLSAIISSFCFHLASGEKLETAQINERVLFKKGTSFILMFFLIFFLGLIIYNIRYQTIDIKFSKGIAEAGAMYKKWNSISRVTVFPYNGNEVFAWGLSPNYKGPFVDRLDMYIDGSAYTPITRFDGDFEKIEFVKHAITSPAYYLKDAPKVLVVGSGGGIDVLTALAFNSRSVTGVEINSTIVDVVKNKFNEFAGNLYDNPRVKIIINDARSYLKKSDETYDIIQSSLVDTWAASSANAYALSENNLYTVEAFVDYLQHLENDGVLTITRWADTPPGASLRIVSLGLAALERLNINYPEKHFVIIREYSLTTVILKKTPFIKREIEKLEEISKNLNFDIVYAPSGPQNEIFAELINSKNPKQFWRTYPFDVSPPTDNKPFFFQTSKIKSFINSFKGPMTNPVSILTRLFLVLSITVILFIFVPLFFSQEKISMARSRLKIKNVLYFACLGAGFMFIEISFLQKFTIFLGLPSLTFSVVLFSLLFFCGAGSFFTNKFKEEGLKFNLRIIVLFLIFLLGLIIIFLPVLFDKFIIYQTPYKIIFTIFFLMPLGFLMGMPLPMGIKLIKMGGQKIIPWAWGVNCAASVLGSVLSVISLMIFGFNITLIAGCSLYFSILFIIPESK